jgi:hypothetical protein
MVYPERRSQTRFTQGFHISPFQGFGHPPFCLHNRDLNTDLFRGKTYGKVLRFFKKMRAFSRNTLIESHLEKYETVSHLSGNARRLAWVAVGVIENGWERIEIIERLAS